MEKSLRVTEEQFLERMLALGKKEYNLPEGGEVWEEVKQDLKQAFMDMALADFVLVEKSVIPEIETALTFIDHIQGHIKAGDDGVRKDAYVICKFCGRTPREIYDLEVLEKKRGQ